MTPDTPRQRREGWPWPAARPSSPTNFDSLHQSQALVQATAVEVARLTDELRLALRRLDEAQLEERVASECVASDEAARAIARARQRGG